MTPLIEIKHLKKYFKTPKGWLHAVDDVNMSINRGETMGIVGESGCGKSTLGRTVIRIHDPTDGEVLFDGRDLAKIDSKKQLKQLRKDVQIIFQDPFSSLNPRMTVEQTIKEPLQLHFKYSKGELADKTEEIMSLVGIDKRIRNSYPHELDGGRRQRVGIGRALALDPKFIVCDEPVSALDVSIQAQILNLLMDLQEAKGITYMFITHDMSVVRHISNNISVMYLGQLVETANTDTLFERPLHPYTQALYSAIPSPDYRKKKQRVLLEGELVSPINPMAGCRFAARCQYATEECRQPQVLEELEPNHFVACCRAKELNGV